MSNENNERNPVFMLNGYIWALLVQEHGLQKINGATPIKTADAPELRASSQPYLVYAYTEEPQGELAPYRKSVVTYAVYGKTATEVNEIIHTISRALGTDQSAGWVTKWSHDSNSVYAGVNIAYVGVYGSESAMPPSDEGGYVAGYVEVGYRYTLADKDFSIRL